MLTQTKAVMSPASTHPSARFHKQSPFAQCRTISLPFGGNQKSDKN